MSERELQLSWSPTQGKDEPEMYQDALGATVCDVLNPITLLEEDYDYTCVFTVTEAQIEISELRTNADMTDIRIVEKMMSAILFDINDETPDHHLPDTLEIELYWEDDTTSTWWRYYGTREEAEYGPLHNKAKELFIAG